MGILLMKIELELYEYGGIGCLSKDCKFLKSCANHVSAGDYRTEDGFKPDLIEENGERICHTYDQPISKFSDFHFLPVNYDKLKRGAINQHKLSIKPCINYCI